ncbi:MAG: hypothetical protein NPINA01_03400 [Nitrospinaceae bacterium]|nr:MAG: hypothetical protein NPINA01_03400 [Nitrospinaceae bacterium]
MRKGNLIFKLILGVILLSLIIPVKAPVSYAQAKLCCKKFCAHHIKSTPKEDCHGSHKKNSESDPVNCCQNSCAQKIFRDDHKAPTLNSLKSQVVPVSLKLIQGTAVLNWISIQSPSWDFREHPPQPPRSGPIYLEHSSLLI